jgi:hypothetical protein
MGGPAPDSVNQANKDAGEKVTVANLDVWLHELTMKVAAAVGGTDEERMKNDQASLESLMLVLKASPHHIGKHRRIEINGKPSLVIVDLGCSVFAEDALKGVKYNLRENDSYKGVYVNRDMTRTERVI